MSTPVPSHQHPTPATASDVVVAPSFEEHLHKFWANYSRPIYTLCVIVLVGIIGKGGYEMYVTSQENQVGADYAAASTSEKLKAFAAAHSGHQLAGVAKLRLADEAYVAGNSAQAALDYQAAADGLKTGPFASRARLGSAMAKLQAGQTAEGENQLKQLANDDKQMKAVRAEAAYQLASQAAAAGRNDEALKFLDQVMTVEQGGTWAQRAMMLRATLPAPTAINLPAKP